MANIGNGAAYRHPRAVGPATVLAIGKATPPTAFPQSEYPDFFFDITNSSHKTELKAKFARICKNSGINKRYFHCTEDILRANPSMCTYLEPSLDVRQDIAIREATRDVLYNYGNMSGASVLFVLDHMRRRSAEKKSTTTGEGCDWGLVVGFGPGLTIEVSVLKAIATGH
ncbi:hypothetical protein AXG93_3833s1050 [Marchantia polymorpha subsp. ruderalis]|uniref:Chalcone/stilbene synthase N-terminal domain-containing protein n=1 Tax=Marchantia polymorpha subsp. ruderalis TaxID=1480154 RepID=A0A176VKY5_MARPO|nr:hypothetical protein AXG93_3833s1050 [Marchantia polymorpha subsp. ruderalis]